MVKNKVLYYLAINVNRDYIGLTITALIYRIKVGRVGISCRDLRLQLYF